MRKIIIMAVLRLSPPFWSSFISLVSDVNNFMSPLTKFIERKERKICLLANKHRFNKFITVKINGHKKRPTRFQTQL
jgi:hypothetical protein